MGPKIKVAIVDNGINRKIAEKLKCENELIVDENNSCREDYSEPQTTNYSHGTICSLIIEKYCPECVFDSIRILDERGQGYIERIEPALEWCIQNDIIIVNLSLGTTHFKDSKKMNEVINKYVNKGLIIVAAISNTGYFTFPASFSNVIGVATKESPLLYTNDCIHLGIDAVAPSVHTVKIGKEEQSTSLSNSYAAPFVSAFVAKKMMKNDSCDIYALKKYVREKSNIVIGENLDNPDWIYCAYMMNKKNESKAEFYFIIISGIYEEVEHEVDTIIACSKKELEDKRITNKNLIYLGKDGIENVCVSGFKWSWKTRVQQIVKNQYKCKGQNIPLIIVDIKQGLDKYFILTLFRQYFENDGYNAYVISMEPESVLYRFEYIPFIYSPLTNENVKNFIEGQIFYKQSDLVLWSIATEQETNICNMYPDISIKVMFDDTEVLVYIEKK